MQSESGAYSRLWHDINRELWRSACAGVPPRGFIRAELWRRVDHTRLLEKSAAIRMARKNKAPGPVFRACNWLVETGPVSASHEMPEQSALDPQNAAIPESWPTSYPGVDTSIPVPRPDDARLDHYQAFVYAFVYAAQAAQNLQIDPASFEFGFDFSGHRWTVQGTDDEPFKKITVNFYYICAPPKIWNAIFLAIVKGHPASRRVAEQYVQSSEAQCLRAVYADLSPLRDHDVYDLSRMFDSLNARFFNNALPKPVIAWTTRMQYSILGTYDFHWDILRISKALNDRRVPEYAIEFVMYHEMLHIKHGARRENNRFLAHTANFRAEEKLYPKYLEAEQFCAQLKKLTKSED